MTTLADPIQLIEHLANMAETEREAIKIAIEYIRQTSEWGHPYVAEAANTLDRINAKLNEVKRIPL